MICSVRPSGRVRSEGIGYCSAVSTRLTPFSRTARSIILWHSSRSGPLKSALPQRCVPSPSSLTKMSPAPRRLWRIPFTTWTTSLVGPVGLASVEEPRGFGAACVHW
eukprot:539269-Prorocentrum_minimum.AAC.2